MLNISPFPSLQMHPLGHFSPSHAQCWPSKVSWTKAAQGAEHLQGREEDYAFIIISNMAATGLGAAVIMPLWSFRAGKSAMVTLSARRNISAGRAHSHVWKGDKLNLTIILLHRRHKLKPTELNTHCPVIKTSCAFTFFYKR